MKKLSEIILFFQEQGIVFDSSFIKKTDQEAEISQITHDSREVTPGSLFCCLSGFKKDGHDFATQAIMGGASALLCERKLPFHIPQIIVENVRQVMGQLAAFMHDFPCTELTMIAVTGTNGKSTTTYMIRQMLEKAGIKTGMLGTIIYSDGSREVPGDRTTPESTSIQHWLKAMVTNGCKACVMEASSHGLEMQRLDGCYFDHAVFTNLTPEHLDFHGDMEQYFEAKRILFNNHMRGDWTASVNADDTFGQRLEQHLIGHALSYGISSPSGQRDVQGTIDNISLSGTRLDVSLPNGQDLSQLYLPFTGRYNVYNALGAVCAGFQLGLKSETLRKALETLPQVPGRLERINIGEGIFCIIDYAHSPDALENVLRALKEVTDGRLWAVFGLGGERYQENRPTMGKIAATLADKIIVTMDNPRSEPPERIAEQIASGICSVENHPPYKVILDRTHAVFAALNEARKGDAIMIGGKGPETYMIIGDETLHYNDKETVLQWLEEHPKGPEA